MIRKKNSGIVKIIIIILAVLIALAAAAMVFFSTHILYKGSPYPKSASVLDLSTADLNRSDVSVLAEKLPLAFRIRLPENMPPEDIAALKRDVPDRDLEYDVTVGGAVVPYSAESVTWTDDDALDSLALLPAVREIDLTGVSRLDPDLKEYIRMNGIRCVVSDPVKITTDTVRLEGDSVASLSYAEMRKILYYFENIETADLDASSLTEQEIGMIRQEYPERTTPAAVELGGRSFPDVSVETLTVEKSETMTPEELLEKLPMFTRLRTLDLSESGFSPEEIKRIHDAFPDLDIRYSAELYGVKLDWTDRLLILDGIRIEDLNPLTAVCPIFPNLEEIDMCGCGIPDEEMAALRSELAPAKIVWTVDLRHWKLRTDVKHFATWRTVTDEEGNIINARNIGGNTSQSLDALKYCVELEALDLGHNRIKDLDFLSGLTKLKYLILALNEITDIGPLESLTDMRYLEIFSNEGIDDITALSGMKHLEALCMSGTTVTDVSPLYGISSLRMLYLQGYRFKEDVRSEIARELPDCTVLYKVLGSSGSEWRKDNPYYREMRLALGWRSDLVP